MSELRATQRALVRRQLSKIGIAILFLLLFVALAGSLGVQNVSILKIFQIVLDHLTSNEIFPGLTELDQSMASSY